MSACWAAVSIAALAVIPLCAARAAQGPSPRRHCLWYAEPADRWVEALAIGNGRLGAMVYGGAGRERLQINEDTFWSGGPYDPAHDDAGAGFAEARRLVFAGKHAEADRLVNAKLLGRPSGQMSYQPIGDLRLDMPDGGAVSGYRRELDLDTAVATVRFERDGVRFTREVFSTAADGVIVVRLTADKRRSISLRTGLTTPQEATVRAIGSDELLMTGVGPEYRGIPGALRFACRVRAVATGGVTRSEPGAAGDRSTGARIVIEGADSVTILLDAATSYVNWRDVSGDPEKLTSDRIARAAAKPYARLRSAHIADHRRLFRRATLDLGDTPASEKPTDERLKAFAAGAHDPQLAVLYYQFGRYLLICSSRPGTQPANLQGIWNESTSPPWDSKYTININTEMNYWPAESANLSECGEPLARMLKEMAESGARTAKRMFGARGWVCFHNTDLWRATAAIDGPWAYTPTCGAWLATYLWERYLFSGERENLEEAYSVLKGAAEFFLDTLVEDPKTGSLVTCPTASPENRHARGAYACAGSAMDNQILRDLFAYVIEGSTILNRDRELRAQLEAARKRLPPDRIGKAGQLQEWMDDWDMESPEIHHRHVSHLYGLFPSAQITPRRTPDLAQAVRKSLDIRGDEATGWSLGWKLNLWARLLDSERAYKLLRMLLDPSRTYPNLFDAHPPFQIDGNFGGVSGINEMLLQSHAGEIELLPVLPKAWPSGSVIGLRARGGLEVSIRWRDGRLIEARIKAHRAGEHTVRYGDQTVVMKLRKGEARKLDDALR
ncbi:MAG: glycoside hydrolase family 95 protein [Armatimonadetes bacterium]|nr:glycoside hydrolase family 95 protein [Armatimonadota bacterium]